MPTSHPPVRPRGHGQWIIHRDRAQPGILWRTDDGTVGFLPKPGGTIPDNLDWDEMSAGQRIFVGDLGRWREDNPR